MVNGSDLGDYVRFSFSPTGEPRPLMAVPRPNARPTCSKLVSQYPNAGNKSTCVRAGNKLNATNGPSDDDTKHALIYGKNKFSGQPTRLGHRMHSPPPCMEKRVGGTAGRYFLAWGPTWGGSPYLSRSIYISAIGLSGRRGWERGVDPHPFLSPQ